MYMRWRNTVTYWVKIYNFSVMTFTTSFSYIFIYTNLDTFKFKCPTSQTQHLTFFKPILVAGQQC